MENAQEEGEADEEMNGLENPLMNPLILEKVMSFLQFSDLKKCRLVHPLWNEVSSGRKLLKGKCPPIEFRKALYSNHKKNPKVVENMKEFINIMKTNKNFPFVKFDLETWVFQRRDDNRVLRRFFKAISPTVTELGIRRQGSSGMVNIERMPKMLTFPSLTNITFHVFGEERAYLYNRRTFNFIREILTNSPIESLSFYQLDRRDGTTITNFLERVTLSNNLRFTSLKISGLIKDEHLVHLSKMGLKLKSLHLEFYKSKVTTEKFKMFLESQNSSLERLEIGGPLSFTFSFYADFPCMEVLNCLNIKGSFYGGTNISYRNISYVEQFPKLKRLSFSSLVMELVTNEFFGFEIEPAITVEELIFPENLTRELSLARAARVFPNLKLLEVRADLDMINVVYEDIPDLEELILKTSEIDCVDGIIAGLDTLKKLKVLRLKSASKLDPVEMTDESCGVLMKIKSLQCLDFCGRSPDTISEAVLIEMKKRFLVLS